MGLDYLCHAKKGRDGLGHQCSKTLTGHRAQPEFAKKGTLRIVPQYSWLFSDKAADTVQLTHPLALPEEERIVKITAVPKKKSEVVYTEEGQ